MARPAATAATAARVVSEHAELWPAGALSWLVFLGWLPFLATVPGPPDEASLTFFGAGLVTSGAWPLNVILLAVAAVGVVLAAFVAASTGEAALRTQLADPEGGLGRIVSRMRTILAIRLIAAAPAAVGVMALLLGFAAVAPGEFSSPDIGGTLLVRLLGRLAPLLIVAVVLVLASQALSASAERRGRATDSAIDALAAGLGQVRREPLAALIVVVGTFVVRLAYLGLCAVLLGVLWAPIEILLVGGVLDVRSAGLLVAFVGVWLCLVLGGGALQAWASIWWTLQLASDRPIVPGMQPTMRQQEGGAR